jgi:hypothetical protein
LNLKKELLMMTTKAIKLPDDWYGDDYIGCQPMYPNTISQITKEHNDDGYYIQITGNEKEIEIGWHRHDCYESIKVKTKKEQQALFRQVIRAIYEAMREGATQ